MAGGCNIDFDESGDIVVSDIPDDMMGAIEMLAAEAGCSIEDEMRRILIELSRLPLPSDQGSVP